MLVMLVLACRHPVSTATPPPVPPEPETVMTELRDLPNGVFQLSVDGTVQEAKTEGEVVFVEIDEGIVTDGAWQTWSNNWNSKDGLVVITSAGRLDVPWRKLRLRIGSTWSEHWTSGDKGIPEGLERWFDEGQTVTLAEFALVKGRTYWGQVETEHFHLPPTGPDADPGEGRTSVLVIQDSPDGPPPLTPLFQGWSY